MTYKEQLEQLENIKNLLNSAIKGQLDVVENINNIAKANKYIEDQIAKCEKGSKKNTTMKREDLTKIATLVENKILDVLEDGYELDAENIRLKVTKQKLLPNAKGEQENNRIIEYKENGQEKFVKVNTVARMSTLLNKLVKAGKLKVTLDGNTKLYSKK